MAIPKQLPFVLIVSHALTGHLAPLIRISSALHARGWEVYFLGPTAHRSRIEASGASFIPLSPTADLDDKAYYEAPPQPDYASLHWASRALIDLREQCIAPLPAQWLSFVAALRLLRSRDPERGVVLVNEAFFYGALPMYLGALDADDDVLETTVLGSVCVSVTVPAIRSAELPPIGYPFAFDGSVAGRARNAKLWERSWARKAEPLTTFLDTMLREAGARRGVDEIFLSGANYTAHETILQLGVPGFEYPRSDWPPGFKFAGLVQGPPKSSSAAAAKPKDPPFDWWEEIVANSALDSLPPSDPRRAQKKKVIVVAQGTVEINPHDLIIPTLEAFACREDVLVVAILGWKDASLLTYDSSIKTPANARIADYLSYDAVLAHADVWVHNAGFGAVNHGIANGVPMVVAGEGMDKTENARRVAWSGIGVDLGCSRATSEQVREGVERVLQDEQFTKRIRELQKQSEDIDCFSIVHEELLRIAETRPGIKQRGLER
ncbi:glycosyltransferase family 1 protein [Annulohypoxylon truncatum]|uniref:glycosyltransferase family 1 protein n=1 Tax=Annulohypoxylon truncatum TaxID=327061 RepID=UPI0020085EBC|nr:glycosyltransferase family 1 protein [Annulohypoxylon truncatum]KAI1204617.1 glycosyltransferase family 1 protein [Annulohypoxylon truncatum]